MITSEVIENVLIHYGKKGMKWGVRRRLDQHKQIKTAEKQIFKKHNVGRPTTGLRPSDYPRIVRANKERRAAIRNIKKPSEVTIGDRGKKLKSVGGHGRPAHTDALRAREIGQVGKKSGLKALSNEELQAYNQRLNLEQQAKRLSYNDKSPPVKFVSKLLGQTGNQTANELSNTASSAAVKKILSK